MERLLTRWQIVVMAGIAVIALYNFFTFTSLALFPPPFSAAVNWLSDLGNSGLNPHGAIFYNLGCITTGITLIPFFIGLFTWYSGKNWRTIIVMAGQIAGIASAISLIMIGIFSEDSGEPHIFWSDVFFKINLGVLIIAGIGLLVHKKSFKLVPIYGFVVAVINVMFVALIAASPPLEWLTVFTALGFVGLIVVDTIIKFGKKASK